MPGGAACEPRGAKLVAFEKERQAWAACAGPLACLGRCCGVVACNGGCVSLCCKILVGSNGESLDGVLGRFLVLALAFCLW